MEALKQQPEFSLKDWINSMKGYGLEIKRNRKIILFAMIPFIAYYLYKTFSSPVQYIARATFMLNESEGGQSGLASILGQFGLNAPGQQVSLQKIVEIAKTRKIAESVFFQKIKINNLEDYLGNFLIDELVRTNEWFAKAILKPISPLRSFRFTHGEVNKFSETENLALQQLHKLFLSKLETGFNEKTGIMDMATRYTDQNLSYLVCIHLFNQLSTFYINKSVERQQETFDNLQHKVDSLRDLIYRKDYSLANIKDTYRNTWLNENAVPQIQVDRDIKVFSILYGEALKNLEFASFTLQTQTPFIQALDLPIIPLEVKKEKLLFNLGKAIAIALLISVGFIILRKIIRDN